MTRVVRFKWAANVLALVALVVPTSGLSEPAPGTPLSLRISPSDGKTEYLPLLPVILTMELTNTASTTQSVADTGLDVVHSYGWETPRRYCFEIEKPDGSTGSVHFSDWVDWTVDAGPMAVPPESLGPGRTQVLDFCLGFGVDSLPDREIRAMELRRRGQAIFSVPGRYRVRLTMPRFKPVPLRSNVLMVVIREPEATTDSQAYAILSQSRWPEIFLTPLVTRSSPHGISVLFGPPTLDGRITTQPLETCRQIVGRCPESAYAPFAKMFLGSGLASGWTERRIGTPAKKTEPHKRLEGLRLIRQAVGDANLPRRYREVALLNLIGEAEELAANLRWVARKRIPSLESILGSVSVSVESPAEVFQLIWDRMRGTLPAPGYEMFLQRTFTPDQIKVLEHAVVSDPNIAMALDPSPLEKELQGHVEWARGELRKIPWRDPVTGNLTFPALPAEGP